MTDWAEDLERDGFAITEGVLGSQETDRLLPQLTPVVETLDGRAGSRALLRRSPAIAALAHSEEFLHFIRPVLGDSAVPVRAVLFDKRPEANWLVPWHQDLSVVVAKRVDAVGWGQWSEKDGMVHVQPPVSMLESMLTVRLHLDDCGEDNGPLRVLPGSHRLGRLTSQ